MKKFSLFLLSLFACLGAVAQSIEIKDGTYFKALNRDAAVYLTADATNEILTKTDKATSFSTIWKAELVSSEAESATYHLYNPFLKLYAGTYTGSGNKEKFLATADKKSAGTFKITTNDAGYMLFQNMDKEQTEETTKSYISYSTDTYTIMAWGMYAISSQWNVSAATLNEIIAVESEKVTVPAAMTTSDYYMLSFNGTAITTQEISVGTDGVLAAPADLIRKPVPSLKMASALWQMKGTQENCTLLNANTNAYYNERNTTGNLAADKSIAFKVIKGQGADNTLSFETAAGTQSWLNAYTGANGDVDDAKIAVGKYAGIADPANSWDVFKITKVPVAISSVGYASVGFPFAVKVPSEVKAYYVASINADKNVLNLTEIADGVIPANCGAILVGEEGTAVLDITTTATTYADNQLKASAARRLGFTSGDTYVLANKASGIGFYKSEVDAVPANKAYLLTTIVDGAANAEALAFNFGGVNTGIQTIVSEQNNTYFDLNGRRVLYPTKGIYVNGNGKKVLFQ